MLLFTFCVRKERIKIYIHQTMEYYSVLKRNEPWKDMCILLDERSESENTVWYMIPTIWHSGKGKTRDSKKIHGAPFLTCIRMCYSTLPMGSLGLDQISLHSECVAKEASELELLWLWWADVVPGSCGRSLCSNVVAELKRWWEII